jgi:hypothetical protein
MSLEVVIRFSLVGGSNFVTLGLPRAGLSPRGPPFYEYW